ncbi:hypothetical protein LINGRAHAP2_LOCUS28733 [Linum grandiflorum]
MEKPPTTAAAGGNDRISQLPDEILHSILSHMLIAEEAAKTCVLSSRWAYLWRSYPVVESSLAICQKFIESTMERFSRDEQLGMSALKIKVTPDEATFRSGACEQLLELASKRKAEYIQVDFEMRLLRPWYVRFRSLTLRFSEFEAIKVCCKLSSCEVHNLDWPKKNLDYTKHPTSIPHLKIEPHPSFLHPLGLKVLYDVLFWACHPKILTICDKYSYRGKMLVDYVLSQYRRKLAVKDDEEGFNGRRSWQHQLKDVNIIAQDVRENNGLMGVSENVLASLKLENQVCLMLSWD